LQLKLDRFSGSSDATLSFLVNGCHYEISNGDFTYSKIEANSFDLILTDPPYANEFLFLWEQLGRLASRVLKPGAYLIAYAGTYTYPKQRLALESYLSFKQPEVLS
jgi:16S rRNA G966 N2-methylase RsmD